MKKFLQLALVVFAACALQVSCTKNKFEKPADPAVVTCDTASVAMSYSTHVRPILLANCGTNGCHDAVNKFGGWDLSACTPSAGNGVQACGISGKLVSAIEQNGPAVKMPVGGKLQDCEIAKIRTWVRQGSLDN